MKNIKLITILYRKGQETLMHEMEFKNLNQLKKYIKECGGIKSFKWKDEQSECLYLIKGECEQCKECYYEYKYGKYRWFDCNGYVVKEAK